MKESSKQLLSIASRSSMASNDKVPCELDCSNLPKEWPKWKQKLLLFMRATDKMEGSELNKASTLLWYIGDRGREIFNSLYPNNGSIESLFTEPEREEGQDATEVTALKFTDVLDSFDEYCLPQKNLAME